MVPVRLVISEREDRMRTRQAHLAAAAVHFGYPFMMSAPHSSLKGFLRDVRRFLQIKALLRCAPPLSNMLIDCTCEYASEWSGVYTRKGWRKFIIIWRVRGGNVRLMICYSRGVSEWVTVRLRACHNPLVRANEAFKVAVVYH